VLLFILNLVLLVQSVEFESLEDYKMSVGYWTASRISKYLKKNVSLATLMTDKVVNHRSKYACTSSIGIQLNNMLQ